MKVVSRCDIMWVKGKSKGKDWSVELWNPLNGNSPLESSYEMNPRDLYSFRSWFLRFLSFETGARHGLNPHNK